METQQDSSTQGYGNRYEWLVDEHAKDIADLKTSVYGNGQDGLLTKVGRLQSRLNALICINIGIFIALATQLLLYFRD